MPKLSQELDNLIAYVKKNKVSLKKSELNMIDQMIAKVKEKNEGENKHKELLGKLDKLVEAIYQKDNSFDLSPMIEAIKQIKMESVVNVPEVKIPEVKPPVVNIPKTEFPSEMSIKKPVWYSMFNPKPIIDKIEELKESIFIPPVIFPTEAKKPMSVRLSDGTKFYRALGGIASGISSMMSFRNSKNEQQAALVDDDGNVQVDVLSSGLPDGAATSASQDIQIDNQTNGEQRAKIVQEVTDSTGNASFTIVYE